MTDLVSARPVPPAARGFAIADPAWRRRLLLRRVLFATAVLATVGGLGVWMAKVLSLHGWQPLEFLMLASYLITTPWVAVGLWNAVIGVLVLRLARDPVAAVTPPVRRVAENAPVTGKIAVIMPVYNEDAARVFKHLKVVSDSLEATGQADRFDIHLLSDSNDPATMAAEDAGFARWQSGHPRAGQIFYRRRVVNDRRKVGNIKEFVDRCGDNYDAMVVLDADSVMTGNAIVRLVRVLEANPDAGIIQALSLGLPSKSGFARLFQFGMRHGMRVYATGQAWWQGDEGPYWGHNAVVRIAPFRAHCDLPDIPQGRAFPGQIISHDQIEAAVMRQAGYGVWVVPEEGGSYEENPPTYFDFLKRDLRWCQGNTQYLGLIGMKGFRARPMGWFQIGHAILMYLSVPAWLAFIFAGFTQAALYTMGVADEAILGPLGSVSVEEGLWLFLTMMALVFAPKLVGVAGVLTSATRRRTYGGAGRLLISTLAEIVFSILLSPVIAVAVTLFLIRLVFGRRVGWGSQERDAHAVPLGVAVRGLWPQLAIGAGAGLGLAFALPSALPWAVPFFGSLLLSVPFACLTADPGFGRWLTRHKIAAIPEELATPPELLPVVAPVHEAARPQAGRRVFAPAVGSGD
ncbi:MAG: glucans biosynthesis glucosyltransferase MdoH [Rhodospirillaceae bacterium]|nr:glucans biosynthesis glucosyltransferase MdoH [Rhodospirillaceae bacterium]